MRRAFNNFPNFVGKMSKDPFLYFCCTMSAFSFLQFSSVMRHQEILLPFSVHLGEKTIAASMRLLFLFKVDWLLKESSERKQNKKIGLLPSWAVTYRDFWECMISSPYRFSTLYMHLATTASLPCTYVYSKVWSKLKKRNKFKLLCPFPRFSPSIFPVHWAK